MDMKATAPELDDLCALAAELRGVISKLKRRLRDQAGVGDLTHSQSAVLLRLEKNGPATTSGLARSEGMRPQSMATIVAALEGAGFICSTPDPADRRQTLFSLTEEYRRRVRDGRSARQDWLLQQMRTQLSTKEQQHMHIAVELLRRLADT